MGHGIAAGREEGVFFVDSVAGFRDFAIFGQTKEESKSRTTSSLRLSTLPGAAQRIG